MLKDPLFVAVALAMLVVVAILARGIGGIGRGGEAGAQKQNKLMQYRIMAQGVAVILILLFIYIRRAVQ